jgi:hypothetical protein
MSLGSEIVRMGPKLTLSLKENLSTFKPKHAHYLGGCHVYTPMTKAAHISEAGWATHYTLEID